MGDDDNADIERFIQEIEQARENIRINGLQGALENLFYKFGNIFDYKPLDVLDDWESDLPLSQPQRRIRIEASGYIKGLFDDQTPNVIDLMDEMVLEKLHISLFDRCAAVRENVSVILGEIGSNRSLKSLRKLIDTEDECMMVKKRAKAAFESIADKGLKDGGWYD